MHSRIIAMYCEEPQYIDEDTMFEYMGGRADYVIEIDDIFEAKDWIHDIGQICLDDGTVSISVEDIEKVLRGRYDAFKQMVDNLTFEQFTDNLEAHVLSSQIEDKFGVYFYTDWHGLVTKDYFMRSVLRWSKENPELLSWKVTQVFDYHY